MKAKITIEKSFDDGLGFSKDWENGDFEEFMQKEGEYLDRLAATTQEHGRTGDSFKVVYTVEVTK